MGVCDGTFGDGLVDVLHHVRQALETLKSQIMQFTKYLVGTGPRACPCVRASSGEIVGNSQPVNSKRREAKEGRTSFHSRIWWVGTAVRDHLCVTDLCAAIDLVLYEDVPGQAYNVKKKLEIRG